MKPRCRGGSAERSDGENERMGGRLSRQRSLGREFFIGSGLVQLGFDEAAESGVAGG
jgi:hypothetical protein